MGTLDCSISMFPIEELLDTNESNTIECTEITNDYWLLLFDYLTVTERMR